MSLKYEKWTANSSQYLRICETYQVSGNPQTPSAHPGAAFEDSNSGKHLRQRTSWQSSVNTRHPVAFTLVLSFDQQGHIWRCSTFLHKVVICSLCYSLRLWPAQCCPSSENPNETETCTLLRKVIPLWLLSSRSGGISMAIPQPVRRLERNHGSRQKPYNLHQSAPTSAPVMSLMSLWHVWCLTL